MAEQGEIELRLISPQDAAKQIGISVRGLLRMAREGLIPSPVHISEQRIGFYAHEINAWLSSRPRTREA